MGELGSRGECQEFCPTSQLPGFPASQLDSVRFDLTQYAVFATRGSISRDWIALVRPFRSVAAARPAIRRTAEREDWPGWSSRIRAARSSRAGIPFHAPSCGRHAEIGSNPLVWAGRFPRRCCTLLKPPPDESAPEGRTATHRMIPTIKAISMNTPRLLLAIALLLTTAAIASTHISLAQSREPAQERPASERQILTPDNYSPLGFLDLLAYEQAYPATVRHPALFRAGLREILGVPGHRVPRPDRRSTASGPPSARRPAPESGLRQHRKRLRPRLRARDFADLRAGRARAGSGSARPAAASGAPTTRCTPTIRRGAGSGTGSAPTTSAASRSIRTIAPATRSTSAPARPTSPNNSGAGTGLYRSTDGGDHWTRVPTMIVDPAVSAGRDRLHVHARHQHGRRRSRQPADDLRRRPRPRCSA